MFSIVASASNSRYDEFFTVAKAIWEFQIAHDGLIPLVPASSQYLWVKPLAEMGVEDIVSLAVAASKALSSANSTAHAVSSVARSDAMMV